MNVPIDRADFKTRAGRSLILGLLGCGSLLLTHCASVQSGQLYQSTPYTVAKDCQVYGIRAQFLKWPQANEIPIKLGAQIAEALNVGGFRANFIEAHAQEIAATIHGLVKLPVTYFIVAGDSVVIETNQYGASYPNGISFYTVEGYDGATGTRVAKFKLRVATGLLNFKSAEGGFKSTAMTFVHDSVDPSGHLLAPPR